MQKIVVLTGAGISAESGISTFRDSNGLWEGYDVMDVASTQGWAKNQDLVLDFYNQRRRQLKDVVPNAAHISLAQLEEYFEVVVVTQNVDNLHERGGSSRIIHLHGELNKVRSEGVPSIILDWNDDVVTGDLCPNGYQLRPHIVWFGEMVPMLESAIFECESCDILIIIGTSMQVYPAASLIEYVKPNTAVYFIDPRPNVSDYLRKKINPTIISENASVGVPTLVDKLILNLNGKHKK